MNSFIFKAHHGTIKHTSIPLAPFVSLTFFPVFSPIATLLCFPPTPSPSNQGNALESEHISELTEEEYETHIYQRQDLKGFMWLDAKYLNPFFTRRLTQEVGGGGGGWGYLCLRTENVIQYC